MYLPKEDLEFIKQNFPVDTNKLNRKELAQIRGTMSYAFFKMQKHEQELAKAFMKGPIQCIKKLYEYFA